MGGVRNPQLQCLYSGQFCILCVTPKMSWSLEFDEAITLAKGQSLRTLRDAGHYILALPKRETAQRHWQTAMACLLSAAQKRGPVMIARIAMLRALQAGQPKAPLEPKRKPAKKFRIVR